MAGDPGPRAFLDTNVLFSGIYSPHGPPGVVLERFGRGDFIVVVSQHVLGELVWVFQEKLPAGLAALQGLLLNSGLQIVPDPPLAAATARFAMLDPEDAVILEAAVAAHVDFFVTGDSHFLEDLAVSGKYGLTILTPPQFLARLDRP